VIGNDDPRVGLVDSDGNGHRTPGRLAVQAAQGAVVAIDAEGLDATPGAGHALQRRRAIDTVEEAPVRGGAHAIAVEVRDFLSGRADLLQRAIGHVDTEDVDTAAQR